MSFALLYFLFVIFGVGIEIFSAKLYRHFMGHHLKRDHFIFGRYVYLLLAPLVATILIINTHGMSVLKIFFFFALFGPVMEWLVGSSYYQMMGVRLWTYKKFTYKGHTSLLTMPLWGMAGVLFYLIARV